MLLLYIKLSYFKSPYSCKGWKHQRLLGYFTPAFYLLTMCVKPDFLSTALNNKIFSCWFTFSLSYWGTKLWNNYLTTAEKNIVRTISFKQRIKEKLFLNQKWTKLLLTVALFCKHFYLNKKETPRQVFPCKFYENFENTFFTEHLRMTASASYWKDLIPQILTYNQLRKMHP